MKRLTLLKYLVVVLVFIFTLGPIKTFANDTITSNETVANVSEVKASRTLNVVSAPIDGESITIGSCVVGFATSTGPAEDLNCDDDVATIRTATTSNQIIRTNEEIATDLQNITNATSTSHGALSVSVASSSAVTFTTSGTESSSSSIEFVDGTSNKILSTEDISGVIPVAQVVTFTPVGAEGDGVNKGIINDVIVTINGTDYPYETAGDGVEVDVVTGLDELLQEDADVTCTDDESTITCTAKIPGTSFTYNTRIVFKESWVSGTGSGSSGASQRVDLASVNSGGNISGEAIEKLVSENSVHSSSTSQSSFVFSKKLSQGMQGDDVRELQKRLTREGVYFGPITGLFGPLTKQGVKDFQKKYNINQLGIVGPATLEKLNQSINTKNIDTTNLSPEKKSELISALQRQFDLLLVQFMAMISQDYPEAIELNKPLPADLRNYGAEEDASSTERNTATSTSN